MFNMSSSEGPKFAAAANEMARRAKELGPNPVRVKHSLKDTMGEHV